MLEGYKVESSVSEDIIKKYSDSLPKTLIDIWKNQGFGTLMDGYLKIINPDDYYEVFKDSYYASDVAIPIIVTAFDDIITWEKNKFVGIVQYRYGESDIMIPGFDRFLMLLKDSGFIKKFFSIDMYKDAVALHGSLGFDECFGFVPILALGGSEKVESLKIVKAREHIAIINALVGPV